MLSNHVSGYMTIYAAGTAFDTIGGINPFLEFSDRWRAHDNIRMLPYHDPLRRFFYSLWKWWRIQFGKFGIWFWVRLICQHSSIGPHLPIMDPKCFGGLRHSSVVGQGQKVIPNTLSGFQQVGNLLVFLRWENSRPGVSSCLRDMLQSAITSAHANVKGDAGRIAKCIHIIARMRIKTEPSCNVLRQQRCERAEVVGDRESGPIASNTE